MSRLVRAAAGAVTVVALVVGAVATHTALAPTAWLDGPTMPDLDGRTVVVEVSSADVGRATGDAGRLRAPRQGLDVPLRTMASPGTVVTPPTLTDAFRVEQVAGAAVGRGTVVVMHAVQGGRAPGNALFEAGAAEPAVLVAAGDPLVVGDATYVVTRTEVLAKAAAGDRWAEAGDPDALVLLTCLQRAGASGPAAENLVVHAVRA